MIIKQMTIKNYGPFSSPVTIDFHPEVTVLTGPNDTGKTSVLRLIELICKRRIITEGEANLDRILDARTSWKDDPEITCEAKYISTSLIDKYLVNRNIGPGTEMKAVFRLAPNAQYQRVTNLTNNGARKKTDYVINKYPVVFYFHESMEEIRSVIDLGSPNATEAKLLLLAFGQNPLEKFSAMSDWNITRTMIAGERQLNTALNRVMPEGMNYEVLLDKVVGVSPFKLSVALRDQHFGDSPIHLHGAGVRKILSLMVHLLDRNLDDEFTYILLDEPENSLHPASQHMFRRFLEQLGKKENIQVIYATHSPAMINPLHGDRIRLFYRSRINEKATSLVNNKPYDGNFLAVRTSLGLSPADSLLYAPVTIVVEGPTEVLSISKIFQRLVENKVDGYESLADVMNFIYILDGQGDSFDKWCNLIKSQGAAPILFVDGDKVRRVNQLKEKLDDVPVVSMEEGKEFEEIVPRPIYIDFLRAELKDDHITWKEYQEWENSVKLHPRMMFSKRVERWIESLDPDLVYYKPRVMSAVIDSISLENIDLSSINELIEEIKKILQRIL